jgi:membrane-anchored glycerophosphoryl diester phosphodiesterase (GDPDase)
LGSILNVLNYVVAVLLLSATFAISSTAANGGLALLAGIGATIILWGIGWIQVALFRGISAFFLMRGLAHLKSVSSV